LDKNKLKNAPPGLSRRLRVGITYNLKKNAVREPFDAEAEFDDLGTILAIKDALESAGHDVELFEVSEALPVVLAERRPDIVFNIAEGVAGRGREAQVPAVLNFLHIPFTGSDETTMCVAMDKALTKRLLASYGIRTPKYRVYCGDANFSADDLSLPLVVKPNAEGSSKGISGLSIVSDAVRLRELLKKNFAAYKQDMLVEEYIRGREFTVAVLGNGGETRVFPPMEIVFKDSDNAIYGYEVKREFRKHVDYRCPPDISRDLRAEIENTAREIYKILKCRDCARIDFRLSTEGLLHFIEINPLPGLAPGYSDFPMIAEFCGVGYAELILSILDCALARYGQLETVDER